jgi:hypothetical protein
MQMHEKPKRAGRKIFHRNAALQNQGEQWRCNLALCSISRSFRDSRSENPESIELQITWRIGFRVRAEGRAPE